MDLVGLLRWVVKPLASRKVRVALVTLLGAYTAQYGVGVSEEVLLTIVSVGVALILGIAHEDQGSKSAGGGDRLGPDGVS